MRYLTVHRERALACFAMQYDCILNREQAAFVAEHEGRPIEEGLGDWPRLRNGGTIRIEIGDGETTFFAVCQTEHKLLCTQTLTIPAGEESVNVLVKTEYNGDRKLSLTAEVV